MKLFKGFNKSIFGLSLIILFVLLFLSLMFSLNVQPPKVVSFFHEFISFPTDILGLGSFFGYLMSMIVNIVFYALLIERIIYLLRKKKAVV